MHPNKGHQHFSVADYIEQLACRYLLYLCFTTLHHAVVYNNDLPDRNIHGHSPRNTYTNLCIESFQFNTCLKVRL